MASAEKLFFWFGGLLARDIQISTAKGHWPADRTLLIYYYFYKKLEKDEDKYLILELFYNDCKVPKGNLRYLFP